jgi:uncharacterized protein YjiK
MKNFILVFLSIFIWITTSGQTLKPTAKYRLNIREISDLTTHPNGNDFIATSDFGEIYILDSTFQVKLKSDYSGDDFEGLCIFNDTIYVSEDRDRQLVLFEPTKLAFLRAFSVPFQMRNGDQVEGMIGDFENKTILLFSEDKPVEIFFYNPNTGKHEVRDSKDLPEIASLDFWNNRLFALSDESPELLELDPKSFSVIQRWRIQVNNAEGLCFRNGMMYIVSDELRKAYQFEIPAP